jgi:glutamine synthetase
VIEAQTMIQMSRQQILPAAVEHQRRLAQAVSATESAGVDASDGREDLEALTELLARFRSQVAALSEAVERVPHGDPMKGARYARDAIFSAMQDLRDLGDAIEDVVAADLWPMPTYRELLSIR